MCINLHLLQQMYIKTVHRDLFHVLPFFYLIDGCLYQSGKVQLYFSFNAKNTDMTIARISEDKVCRRTGK